MKANGSIPSVESLRKDLEDRKRRQTNLINAIETGGDIPSLTARLRDMEAEVAQIQDAIDAYRPLKLDSALEGLREHVTRALLQLKESLAAAGHGDLARAKAALAKHVGKLVLTPETRDGRPVYKVTGSITVPPDGGVEKCRMQLVARDGIEPPTQAFQGC